MIRLSMGYPSHESSVDILKSDIGTVPVNAVINREQFAEMQKKASEVYVDDSVYDFIVNIAEASRKNENIALGLSPRGTKALLRMAKAYAFMLNKDYVGMDDVIANLSPVSAHRIVLSTKAKAKEIDVDTVLQTIVHEIRVAKVSF